MSYPQPLKGVRVLDLSLNLAGPFCGQILGDLGAEVLKVERPGAGDPARAWAPPAWGGEGTLYLSANRGKRSVALELEGAEGREVLEALLGRADVLITAFRPDVAVRFGLTEEALRPRHPDLLLCEIVAFNPGTAGEGRPGFDPLAQAHAGLLSVTGPVGGPPTRVGTSVVDLGTGIWAALGVVAALLERERSSAAEGVEGRHLRISLEDTALTWMGYHLQGALATGQAPGPMGTGLGMIAPYGTFPASDGLLMVAAGNDALFGRLCGALGLTGLASDPEFATNPSRVRGRIQLESILAEATQAYTVEALEARLVAAGVPCARVRNALEVAQDPEVQGGPFRAEPHPTIPNYRAMALPLVFDGERSPPRPPPPAVGEHTAQVLRELGLEADSPHGLPDPTG